MTSREIERVNRRVGGSEYADYIWIVRRCVNRRVGGSES
jgi:hypothetical protein